MSPADRRTHARLHRRPARRRPDRPSGQPGRLRAAAAADRARAGRPRSASRDVQTVVRHAGVDAGRDAAPRDDRADTRRDCSSAPGPGSAYRGRRSRSSCSRSCSTGPTARVSPASAAPQLRGLLDEVKREHTVNRALMQPGARVPRSPPAARRRRRVRGLPAPTGLRPPAAPGPPPAARPRPGGLTAMTIPTFTGYDTALRGLEAEQIAIDTTGQNIDNASTPGYSRETVNLTRAPRCRCRSQSSVNSGAVNLGSGVDATTINRVRNQFLDIQYRAQNTGARQRQRDGDVAHPGPGRRSTSRERTACRRRMTSFYNDWGNLANARDQRLRRRVARRQRQVAGQPVQLALRASCSTVQSQAGTQLSDLTGLQRPARQRRQSDRQAQRRDQPAARQPARARTRSRTSATA